MIMNNPEENMVTKKPAEILETVMQTSKNKINKLSKVKPK